MPSDEDILRIMEYAVGGAEMREYLPLLEEELAARGEDRRAPGWTKAEVAPDVEFKVLIIGAGMSGLLAAHRLQQAGVDFVIVDKNEDVGGTWFENQYPGCRVDNPNHNYSYSFAQRHDWPLHFSTQDVLLDYLAALRGRVRPSVPHPLPHRGAVGDVVRRGSTVVGQRAHARRQRGDHRGERGRQRRRPVEPPVVPGHPRPRLVSRACRSTRRAGGTTST